MIHIQKENIKNLLYSIQEESSIIRLVKRFLSDNSRTGYLIVKVFQESTSSQKVPIANAIVIVSKYIGDGNYISRIFTTNENGETPIIPLPAPITEHLDYNKTCMKFTTYNLRIEAADFINKEVTEIRVFEDTTSLIEVALLPGKNKEVNEIYLEEQGPIF